MQHKRTHFPTVRSQRQPFVVASDIMLTRVTTTEMDEIVVSRLYDHAQVVDMERLNEENKHYGNSPARLPPALHVAGE